MSKLEVAYGRNTYCFLAECATCGKPYHPDTHWRTVYTSSNERKNTMWLLYCPECFDAIGEEMDNADK